MKDIVKEIIQIIATVITIVGVVGVLMFGFNTCNDSENTTK